jgi:hypothetical protein
MSCLSFVCAGLSRDGDAVGGLVAAIRLQVSELAMGALQARGYAAGRGS